jgi:hypothetical protein
LGFAAAFIFTRYLTTNLIKVRYMKKAYLIILALVLCSIVTSAGENNAT